jgi:hypothetical protein
VIKRGRSCSISPSQVGIAGSPKLSNVKDLGRRRGDRIVDIVGANCVVEPDVDLEKLARELGIMQSWETLTSKRNAAASSPELEFDHDVGAWSPGGPREFPHLLSQLGLCLRVYSYPLR